MDLDGTDINILKVLQVNGRLSFRQISERVKVSVPTVSNKISNLENLGVIRGYQADLDTERLGEISVILTIKAKPSELAKVAEKFDGYDNLREVFALSNGRLVMICTFIESYQINEFLTKLGSIPEVIEYDIANVVRVIKENSRALVDMGASIILQCAECGKDIWGEALRIKVEGDEYYFCSAECVKAFQDRLDKSRAKT